jgi:O-antigen/teichoic acid export membrane protein
MVYLARSGFWSLFGQIIGSLSSFVVVLIIANMLPKESLGQYRFMLSAVSLLGLFTLPGIGITLLRSVARGNNVDMPAVARAKIKWGFLGSLAALISAGYYFYMGNEILGYCLVAAAAALPFLESFSIYAAYYKGKHDFKTASTYDAISRIFQAAIIITAALVSKSTIVLIAAFLFGQIIARYYFYRKTLKRIEPQSAAQVVSADDTISYGKKLSVTSITSTIQGNLDKLLIWHFLGSEALAVYYVALTIPNNLVLLFNVVPRIAMPKFSTNTWLPHERITIIRKIGLFALLLVVPAIVYYLLLPLVMPLIFSSYDASIIPALVFAALIIISPVSAMIDQVMAAQKTVKNIFALQILELVAFTTLFVILYAPYGVTGVAIALVGTRLLSLITGIFLVKYTNTTDDAPMMSVSSQ